MPLAPDGNIWGSNRGGYANSTGVPQLVGVGAAGWSAGSAPHNGVWTFAGPNQPIDFFIPNSVNQNNHKDIWIQLHYFAGGSNLTPDVYVQPQGGNLTLMNLASSGFASDGWTHAVYTITL